MRKVIPLLFLASFFFACGAPENSSGKDKEGMAVNSSMAEKPTPKMKALIIDGENNHGVWPKTTMMCKDYLEQTGLFEVDIVRKAFTYSGPHHDVKGLDTITELIDKYPIPGAPKTTITEAPTFDPNFNPDFTKYDLVVSNLGQSSPWPDQTKLNFEKYMANGGGLAVIHAANNAFGDWTEFNKMIGLGAWGDRDEKNGPYVYYDENDKLKVDPSAGQCGSHGPQMEYLVQTRAAAHPIMKGLPTAWMHTKDELYDRMRGPAENMTILATAYSDVEGNAPPWDKLVVGSGRHEPLLLAVEYHQGRVFHTAMGHMDYSFECAGFITTLQRGAEWAATGKVTQGLPADFPSANQSSARKWDN